jgi:hypothetical protein
VFNFVKYKGMFVYKGVLVYKRMLRYYMLYNTILSFVCHFPFA